MGIAETKGKEPFRHRTAEIRIPLKRIEAVLLWLAESTCAGTLDEALGAARAGLGPDPNGKVLEMLGMLTTLRRALREKSSEPPLKLDEWYAEIAGIVRIKQ